MVKLRINHLPPTSGLLALWRRRCQSLVASQSASSCAHSSWRSAQLMGFDPVAWAARSRFPSPDLVQHLQQLAAVASTWWYRPESIAATACRRAPASDSTRTASWSAVGGPSAGGTGSSGKLLTFRPTWYLSPVLVRELLQTPKLPLLVSRIWARAWDLSQKSRVGHLWLLSLLNSPLVCRLEQPFL